MGSERRNTLPLKFKLPRVDTLITLCNKVTPCKKNNFICRYGRILNLITTSLEVSALVALSQYYDPPLRCFTFQDFQLALTIEEYERLLGWYVKDHPPFTKLGEPLIPESVAEALHLPIEEVSLVLGPRGFARKFLEEKAWALEKEGKWLPFSAILALLIYGVIHRKGRELGKRHCRAKEPYRQWMVQRAKEVKMPYSVDVPIPSPEPEPVHASKEEVDALKATMAQLTKENEDLRSKLHALDKDHARLKRKSEEDLELLSESRKKAKIKEDLKEKYQEGLAQADMGLIPLVVKLTSYFYNTRAKQKIAMERIEQNQTAMQKEMDLVRAQLGQLMDIMQNVIHRQEENRQANPGANVNMNAANPIIGNGVPIANQTHVEGMPNNPNVANTYHVPIHGGSQAGTEDHDRDFFMHRNEFPKKKEGETNAASTSKGKGKAYRTPYYQAQGSQASAVPTPTRLQRKCTM
ncbi:hypothetical protein KIW84_075261 [Lathyrus oleraceus]|uniref:DUF7745 domain-containing protein n=1 Tax=Pisum sativum TaxID=3888 RepID=A0A9D4VUV6_PEA|nr:hypothetical protein KIW84_075261 [Pisum sativum]